MAEPAVTHNAAANPFESAVEGGRALLRCVRRLAFGPARR